MLTRKNISICAMSVLLACMHASVAMMPLPTKIALESKYADQKERDATWKVFKDASLASFRGNHSKDLFTEIKESEFDAAMATVGLKKSEMHNFTLPEVEKIINAYLASKNFPYSFTIDSGVTAWFSDRKEKVFSKLKFLDNPNSKMQLPGTSHPTGYSWWQILGALSVILGLGLFAYWWVYHPAEETKKPLTNKGTEAKQAKEEDTLSGAEVMKLVSEEKKRLLLRKVV